MTGSRGSLGTRPEDLVKERIARASYISSLYLGYSSISHRTLSQEEITEIGVELIGTIESDWLRSAVIEEELQPAKAIEVYEQDAALITPDSVLLRWTLELIRAGDFDQAASVVDEVRSPYAKARALSYIAISSLSQS